MVKSNSFRLRCAPAGGVLALLACLLMAACGGPPAASPAVTVGAGGPKYMVIETDKGRIVAELYTDPSANVTSTIANFEQKANSGHFNGSIFHRIEGWVIQGGDPTGTGMGGDRMPAEYNDLPFNVGALGVARGGDHTQNNASQFFILKEAAPHLNGQYTNFGEVVEGMDVVNQIAIGDKMTSVTVSSQRP